MHLSYVVPLLFTLSLFTTLESKIDRKSDSNINRIKFWTWGTVSPDPLHSYQPISYCGDNILSNNCPNVKKGGKGRPKIGNGSFPFPTVPTIEVRIVHNSTSRFHFMTTSKSTTYKTVYLPSNLPTGEEYEYVEPSPETMEYISPETIPQKKLNEKKEKSTKTTKLTTTLGSMKTNAFVSKEIMISERSRRYIRNPYDFNLRYMLYPMNPDFFLAMEQSKQAESEVRNQQYFKKTEPVRNRRKINHFLNRNLPWKSTYDQRLFQSGNFEINKQFL